MNDFVFPSETEGKWYGEIVAVLTEYYQINVTDTADRFMFGKRKQEDGATVSADARALK